jgi:hypothetical protein
MSRRSKLAIFGSIVAAVVVSCVATMTSMPGRSRDGGVTPGSEELALARELEADVRALAEEIGERNHHHRAALAAAAERIERALAASGLAVRREHFESSGQGFDNVVAELPGTTNAAEIVVAGAHYDSVTGSPGANDNASGVAALLALARRLAGAKHARTLRLVAFANEEPPWFESEAMGSLVHARATRARGENIVAMLSLETIGCYSDAPGSQTYPVPALGLLYPTTGNFISFVGNLSSRSLVRRAVASFRSAVEFPSEGAALPANVPGVGWSDHWSFWQAGYPAVMVTDTAPFRYAAYHTAQDTPEKLDYGRMARVVLGLRAVLEAELDGSEG